jgi:hypothetical protein
MLPLLPLIFAWSFFAELWRQFRPKASTAPAKVKPPTPMQAAAKRTA